MNQWEIGGVKITRIVELETLSKGTFVLPDATLENVKRDSELLMPHFADANGKMRMSVHALVVESQGRRIVVDTCIGNDKQRGAPAWNMLHTSFLADLEQAGLGSGRHGFEFRITGGLSPSASHAIDVRRAADGQYLQGSSCSVATPILVNGGASV